MADEELDGIESEEEAGLSDSNVTEQESEESAQDAESDAGGSSEEANSEASSDEASSEECPPCNKGAPAWMATFADMATLLMAFFVLILSFSDTEIRKFEQINGSIQNAFGIKKLGRRFKYPAEGRYLFRTTLQPYQSGR